LCRDSKIAWEAVGKVNYERKESEKGNAIFRRSLYVVKDVAEGELFTHENVKSIRPGYGLAPKYLHEVLGSVAAECIKAGTAIKNTLIKKD
ncbi:pseudaminic acid synthase, partial [Pseudoalteromonas sp. 78C3]|uniref:SAF domain-containing protein n=1 Tax=Pseudoalteromonas sp. 78C3 TaxID=2058300 RepID=UPI000CB06628